MGVVSKTAIAVVLLALGITYLPYLFVKFVDYNYLVEYKRLTEPEGTFINLRHGPVHYILEGPKDKSLVVILHGISTSAFAMRDIAKSLSESGMTTLRLDFYGRGHSSSPDDLVHDEDLFVQQTADLLDTLVTEGKITAEQRDSHHIIGWSLGGAVSLMYSSIFPQRIKSATLISPPGLPFEVPFTGKLALVPGLGEFLLAGAVGRYLLEDRVPLAFHAPENVSEIIQDLKMLAFFHFHKEGFNSAFLSSLRNFKLHNLKPVYEKVGKEQFPVLFIWGEKDATVPVTCLAEAKQLIPRAETLVYSDAGHCVHLEKGRETLPLIKNFVAKNDK